MITFEITTDGSTLFVTGPKDLVIPGTSTLTLALSGKLSGDLGSVVLSALQKTAFCAGTPIEILVSAFSAASLSVLPDDFYRTQVIQKDAEGTVEDQSEIEPLTSILYVQKRLHDEIVHTNRIIGFWEKHSLHARFIHVHVLELMGQNPSLSLEDAVVNRIKYLQAT